MKVVHYCLIFSIFVSSGIYAEPTVTIFGLPLGGKLRNAVKLCTKQSLSEICWSDKPISDEHGWRGSVTMPNAVLPKWAEYARFAIQLSKDAEIEMLDLEDLDSDARTIEQSITGRFGLPTGTKTTPSRNFKYDWYDVNWKRRDIVIQMSCGEKCTVKFVSANLAAARDRIRSDSQKRDAARPISP